MSAVQQPPRECGDCIKDLGKGTGFEREVKCAGGYEGLVAEFIGIILKVVYKSGKIIFVVFSSVPLSSVGCGDYCVCLFAKAGGVSSGDAF